MSANHRCVNIKYIFLYFTTFTVLCIWSGKIQAQKKQTKTLQSEKVICWFEIPVLVWHEVLLKKKNSWFCHCKLHWRCPDFWSKTTLFLLPQTWLEDFPSPLQKRSSGVRLANIETLS